MRERVTAFLPVGDEVLGRVLVGEAQIPLGVGVPIHGVPRSCGVVPVQPAGQPQVLAERDVLEQSAKRQR